MHLRSRLLVQLPEAQPPYMHMKQPSASAARHLQHITFKSVHGSGVNVTAMTVASVNQAFQLFLQQNGRSDG